MSLLHNLLYRVALFQSLEKFADAVHSNSLTDWQRAFDKGAAANAAPLYRNFHDYISSETERLTALGGVAAEPGNIARMRTQAWAAHFLPVPLYEQFLRASFKYPFRFGTMHAMDAKKAADKLRHFPKQAARKPVLESVDTRDRKQEWQECTPLVTHQSAPLDIRNVFSRFSADDLHEIAHGEDLSDAHLIEAVARHPLCDWGSALEILHSFSASAYQSGWRDGKTEDDFDHDEQALFRAFAVIAERARVNEFQTRKFRTGFGRPSLHLPDGQPNPAHPANWEKWSIPTDCFKETQNLSHQPGIVFDGGRILPSFDTWQIREQRAHS